jgi:hypothetical protein
MRARDEQARLEELLMQRVTGALSAPEADALAQAIAKDAAPDALEWELAAAELSAVLALDGQSAADALPPGLADRIAGVGEALVRTERTAATSLTVAPTTTSVGPWRAAATWGGWLAAAALAVWVVRANGTGSSNTAARSETVPAVANRGAALRDSLLNADSTLLRISWTATADSSAHNATGDVVWSSKAQRGVMRIAGLLPNDGKKWQYQLWIFDKRRDQRYPVDGGVFDIPAGAHEVFVPIDARVPVDDAILFAITIEQPGGVVVSKRERIALLAKKSPS